MAPYSIESRRVGSLIRHTLSAFFVMKKIASVRCLSGKEKYSETPVYGHLTTWIISSLWSLSLSAGSFHIVKMIRMFLVIWSHQCQSHFYPVPCVTIEVKFDSITYQRAGIVMYYLSILCCIYCKFNVVVIFHAAVYVMYIIMCMHAV